MAVLKFRNKRTESWIRMQARQIGILVQPAEVTIAQFQSPAQCHNRVGVALQQRKAAGKVVMRDRIVRIELDDTLVQFKPFLDPACTGTVMGEHFHYPKIVRLTVQQRPAKCDFKFRSVTH